MDAEAGYGMDPARLVAALRAEGAAGCNLEDTDHAAGTLVDPAEHSEWLNAVHEAASDQNYGLVINARIDVFLAALGDGSQAAKVSGALDRAHAYFEAGVDCVYPIALWEEDALREFVPNAGGNVNVLAIPRAPAIPELAALGVSRVSYGGLLHRQAMEQFESTVAKLLASRP